MTPSNDHPNINRNIHPPFVALFYIILAFILGRFIHLPIPLAGIVNLSGFILSVIGFLCGLAAFFEFRRAQTTLDPHGSVKQIVTSGIYRFTRNPIYLGFFLLVIGLPLNYGYYWGILLAPLFALTLNRLVIEKEEAYLENKFGEDYANYKARVRRWL
jgi:protein-S-isoprenylcysteine O-methyltransferase Ste14